MERTIPALWRKATSEARSRPAYLVEREGGWEEVSWSEAGRRVEDLAFGFLALGVEPRDVVAIVGRTSLEWALADFALALCGAIVAPIYPTSSPAEREYVLEHSEARVALAETEEQRTGIEELVGRLPRLEQALSFADLGELEERGRRERERSPKALEQAASAVGEEDIFTYIYTSGTTGPPKACVIRHRNYFQMVAVVDELPRFLEDDDLMLLWLPLAHNFGRLMHLAGPYAGFTIAFVPDPHSLPEAMRAVRPTILPSAPRMFEKLYTAVKGELDAQEGVKRRLVDWSLAVGRRASPYKRQARRLPPGLAVAHALANRLVYSKVKDRLGGRLRFGISGAAPLAKEIAEYLHSLDVLILEGYGLTECTSACSVNRLGNVRFGTVGEALPGFEIRIAEDGEVLMRSETIFAGYLKDDEATRQALSEDGWLRSGDVGELDADGFLTITDRKKDVLVTAGGKNVAPQNIEGLLKTCPLVSQALVVGDRQPYLVALLTLDEAEARKWAAERGFDGDVSALARDERVRAEIARAVDDVNARLARFEQIKRFALLDRDFGAQEGEMTPTMKLRRRVVEERFASEIEALYADSPSARAK